MADQVITKQELINAQKDAQTLEDVINGGPGKLIRTRLDREVYTLASVPQINTMTREEIGIVVSPKADKIYVDQLVTNAYSGINNYQTQAALLAFTPTLANYTAKALDTKKVWYWNGAGWEDTGLSELDQATQFTKVKFDEFLQNAKPIEQLQTLYVGAVLASGTNSSTQANWRKTTYVPVKAGDRIFYNASCNSTACLIAAFDKNKVFLRNMTPHWTSTAVSAKSGFVDVDSDVAFVILSFYYADSTPYSFLMRKKVLNTELIKDTNVMHDVWSGLGGENLFDSSIATDNGYLLNNVLATRDTWFVSDYIPVTGGEYYTANGARASGASAGTSIHYYDENKEFISTSSESYSAYVPFLIPAEVHYIRINFAKAASKSIHATAVYRGNRVFDDVVREKAVQVIESQKTSVNRYGSKTLLTIGDSITDHHTTNFTYPPIVANHLGMNLFDCAISGTRIRSAFARTAVATNENIASANVITIAHGTNDFKLETAIGTIEDAPTPRATLDDADYRANSNTTGTFYADYKGVIESILSINPISRIMLITPIRRLQPAANNTDTNNRGHKLVDYVAAISLIAEYYGLPVLDNYNTSGFNHITVSQWTSDGLHPTSWAQENVLASKITGFILSN